jgi:hypothetical protein
MNNPMRQPKRSPKGDLSAVTTELPTLEQLGVASMEPETLAELARALKSMASAVEEIRCLQLERRQRLLVESIPNRPTIGYYLRLGNEKPA